ncbi:hypothetical protein OF83DRAFT_213984 [Amylostereum chailletii]|nr:hypothetical protein OF83DRAFT_213984 [Amylostereum chailletii]
MFSCRIQLHVRGHLRAALSHSSLAFTPSRRSLAGGATSSPTEHTVRDGHVTPLRDPPPHTQLSPPPNHPSFAPVPQTDPLSTISNIQQIYAGFRHSTPEMRAQDLSTEDLGYIVRTARKRRHASVMDCVARNLLASHSSRSPSHIALLLNASNVPFLAPSTALALYQALPPADQPAHANAVLSHPDIVNHPKLLDTLAESIGSHLPASRALFWPALSILAHLMEQHRNQEALALFQRLIDAQLIPPEAVRDANQASRDFRVIIVSALVRAYMFWNANAEAGKLTTQLLASFRNKDLDESNATLAIDVLYALMEHPEVPELKRAIELARELSLRPHGPFVPHALLQQIYEACQHHGITAWADHLYFFTQSKNVRPLHQYPPPRGPPLLWLLRHYTFDTKVVYRARKLLTHVVDAQEPVPPPLRASLITIAADQGFATQTRVLYERYSKGRYGALVTGHGGLLVQISTLYASLIRQERAKIRQLQGREVAAIGPPTEPAMEENLLDDLDAVDWDRQHALERRKARLEDFATFCRGALQAYRQAKEPLLRATQADLNALARAYFALGDISEGFQVFGVMTTRQQVPDARDVNVALSAVARQNPRVGMGMIRQMLRWGAGPDNVGLGTVLHHALQWGQMEIVQELFALSKRLKRPFTLRTMDSVIRASIVHSGEDRTALRDNLERALEVLKANASAPYLASVDMGKFCATAAMEVGEAGLAFEFWKLLLRDQAEWGDSQQWLLRRRLAKLICRAQVEKRIGKGEARAMMQAMEWRARRGRLR